MIEELPFLADPLLYKLIESVYSHKFERCALFAAAGWPSRHEIYLLF